MTNLELKDITKQFLYFGLFSAFIIFAGYGFEPFMDFNKVILLIAVSLIVAIVNVKFKNSFTLPIIVIGLLILGVFTYTMTKNQDLFTKIYRWILFGVVALLAVRHHRR